MELLVLAGVCAVGILLVLGGGLYEIQKTLQIQSETTREIIKIRTEPRDLPPPQPTPVFIDTEGLERRISDVPKKVLQGITGSSNAHKGAVGELIGHLKLRALYDRIIPVGDVVDFIGVSLPKEGEEGHIDLIDVKTGKTARLTKEQRQVRDLVKQKAIKFIELRISEVSHEDKSTGH